MPTEVKDFETIYAEFQKKFPKVAVVVVDYFPISGTDSIILKTNSIVSFKYDHRTGDLSTLLAK